MILNLPNKVSLIKMLKACGLRSNMRLKKKAVKLKYQMRLSNRDKLFICI